MTTMVFPHATAEATFTIHMSNGPFQGMMAPQTPWRETAVVSALLAGSRSVVVMPVCSVHEGVAVQVSKCSVTAPPPDCEVGRPGIASKLFRQLDCTSLLVACAGSAWQQHAGRF